MLETPCKLTKTLMNIDEAIPTYLSRQKRHELAVSMALDVDLTVIIQNTGIVRAEYVPASQILVPTPCPLLIGRWQVIESGGMFLALVET